MKTLRRFISTLIHLRTFFKMERSKSNSSGVPLSLKTLSHGFLSVSSTLYDFSKNDSREYLNDWSRLHKASKINDNRRIILDNKLIFQQINKNNKYVKPIVALTKDKRIYIYPDFKEDITDKEKFTQFVKKFKYGLIIKPYTGGGGARISKVIYQEGNLLFNGAWGGYKDFLKYLSTSKVDFLMTEIIKQTGALNKIYPDTLNTTRILTMYDPNHKKAFIAAAVQRIGTDKSRVVDNFTSGGISIKVDIKNGILDKGATSPQKGKLVWHYKHPDTQEEFKGIQIKNWNEIIDYVLSLSEEFFYLPYIGWDVVPMEDGFYILEANTNSDVNLLQIHEGLLKKEQVKRFYKYHKVI